MGSGAGVDFLGDGIALGSMATEMWWPFFSFFFLFFSSFLGRIALHRDGVILRREGAG